MASTKKSSSTSPMKSSICVVFVVLLLVMGTRFPGVHCRALPARKSATSTAEQIEGDESMATAKTFDVSSRNSSSSSSSSSARSFSFNLSSGPSKSGPGH
ncbi:hypothetical protein RHMOL_Rhmol07G0287600 [Rhododendron molle]|uniref:Uncharacterized protein n=1 Tax=Rhododendron molle TaxID=49168 RepID=A0ACC0N5T3_RHOML|nr:hypothetical protein RHMOL_Rhmol07G0287600 [Rhododendron molle]